MDYFSAFQPSCLYSRKENYSRYLDSNQWSEKKRAYWLSSRPNFCWACDKPWAFESRGFNFHHITYKNLFNEKLEDLVLLCAKHHRELEMLWIKDLPNKSKNRELMTYAFICSHRVHLGLSLSRVMPFMKEMID